MENRVEKYNLNAKKAFEFAAGLRIVITGKNRTKRIYGKYRGRPKESKVKLENELTPEEQKALISTPEYAYRYSVKLANKRLPEEVENEFFSTVNSEIDVKYAIDYCSHFDIALPVCLHNRVLIQSAIPSNKDGLRFMERYKIERAERKQKKYLQKFQEHKNGFKIILTGVMRDNNLTEENSIKDLLQSFN